MRRLMNSILSVCIALLSAAAGSALGQSAIVPEPAKTANAIDKLSNGIEHAYKTTPCVVDDEEDRDLYIKVKQIAEAMVKLNGDKIYLELKARAYIDNPTPPEQGLGSWQDLNQHLAPISQNISDLLDLMQENGTYLIRIADLQSDAILLALLKTQKDAYRELANLADPNSNEGRRKVKALADQLDQLLSSILNLERQIGSFVQHPTNEVVKSCSGE